MRHADPRGQAHERSVRRLPLLASRADVAGELLAETVREGSAAADEQMAADTRASERRGRKVPCTKGCSACCSYPLHVALFEVWAIGLVLAQLSAAELRKVRRRVGAAIRRAREAGLELAALGDPRPLSASENVTYLRAHIPCPLLDEQTRTCTVYDVRPLGCRTHVVVDTEPEECASLERGAFRLDAAHVVDLQVRAMLLRWGEGSGGAGLPAALFAPASSLLAFEEACVVAESTRPELARWLRSSPFVAERTAVLGDAVERGESGSPLALRALRPA